VIVLCTGVIGATFGGGATTSACAAPIATTTSVGTWSGEQIGNAAIVVDVGTELGVPPRGWVIAVATAMQESSLINTPDGPDDSVGLFQQRPSQGWGTPAQLLDPRYAAARFYEKLLTVPGWQQLPLTVAAQAVQRSGYGQAYEKWEAAATQLVATIARGTASLAAACVGGDGWIAPVDAPVVSGFRTASRPAHNGVDLGAARGTPIRAAAAGTVVIVRCDISPEGWGCDRDGSPSTPGCGWYVDILHSGEVYTRYCHMLRRPDVSEGQQVLAGQVIGVVGSSGHSSGPHLHFEVHLGSRAASSAVDPVEYLRSKGVNLGGA
jgi:murein DD-endopeptidase MepM/ murein hydrolase activator NlpD